MAEAEGFGVWVNDPRDGARSGYLSNGAVTPWPSDASWFATAAGARSALEAAGLDDDTSVRPGRRTGYVVSLRNCYCGSLSRGRCDFCTGLRS